MEYNLADLWERVADTVPDHEALVCADRRLTFAEEDERATRLANALAARGVGPGDHVACYLYNSIEYLEVMLAAFKLRAVPINVNYRYVEDELRYLLDDADVSAVVFHREFAPKLAAIAPSLPSCTRIVAVDDGTDGRRRRASARVDYETALAGRRARSATSVPAPPTISTSSTPAAPPACRRASCGATKTCSSARWAARAAAASRSPRPRRSPSAASSRAPVACPACPFMHGTAHWMAFSALFTGGTVVIPAEHHLDALKLWQLVEREQANFMVIVGDAFARPMLDALDTDAGRALDVSRLARAALRRRDPLAHARSASSSTACPACSSSTATARPRPAARASRSWCRAATSRPRRSSASPTTRSCSATISGRRRPGVIGRLARAADRSRSATTRTPRRPRRRSRWSTACAGRSPAITRSPTPTA